MAYAARPVADRFWEKVNVFTEGNACWEWTASRYPFGYGMFGVRKGCIRPAHRVAWALTNGAIPDGLFVLHHCDNRLCVRPAHLYLGDHADNMRDARERSRFEHGARHHTRLRPETVARGERIPWVKLTEADVRRARDRHAGGGVSFKQLGRELGVDTVTVFNAVRRKSWAHVE